MSPLQEGVGRRVRGPLGASEERRRRGQRGAEGGRAMAADSPGNAEQVIYQLIK